MNKEERMYELLKHRYDKKITTLNLFEDIEALLQENEQLKEKVKYQKNKIDNKDNWCQLIVDIGFDYDGCNTIESLKGLIDELVRYALNSRDNYDYEEILKGDSLEEENKKYIEDLEQQVEELDKKLFFTKNELDMREKSINNQLNQQNEFIKWLEDYLNLFDYRDIQEQAGYDMLEEILQKYKEIIGE